MASTSLFSLTTLFFFSNWNNIFLIIADCCWFVHLTLLWQPYWHDNHIETSLILCCYAPNDDITALCMGWKAQWTRDHATSFIREAPRHETSRPRWERLSELGWLCTGLGRSWRHHLPPEGALAIPSSPDQKTSRPFGFLKTWKPDLSLPIIAPEELREFWIENRSRVKIFQTKSFQGRLPRTYYTPPACALHNKLSLTWKEPPELGAGVFGALGAGHWASLLLSR